MSLLLTFNNENCTKDKCFCNVSDDQLYACREEAIHDWTKQIFNDGGDTLRLVCEYGYNFETHQVRHIITEAKLNLWIPTMDLNYIHLYILNEGCYAEDLFFYIVPVNFKVDFSSLLYNKNLNHFVLPRVSEYIGIYLYNKNIN